MVYLSFRIYDVSILKSGDVRTEKEIWFLNGKKLILKLGSLKKIKDATYCPEEETIKIFVVLNRESISDTLTTKLQLYI